MSNLVTRTVTGVFFVAIVLAAILFSPYTFILLFFSVTLGTLLEFYRITSSGRVKPQRFAGSLIGLLLFLFVCYVAQEALKFSFAVDLAILFKTPVIILAMIYMLFFIEIFRRKETPFLDIGITVLGVFYIAIPFALFSMIGLVYQAGVYSPGLAIGILVILWSHDTGAYLVGSRFGRRKLIERISPGKTWEGMVGGLLVAVAAGAVLSRYVDRLAFAEWVELSVVVAVAATLGDLLASMLKRSYQLKDSGTFFPGHGGFLGRLDGLLGSAPFASLLLYLLGKI